ncbi:MAG: tRNA pseudouridine(38-40) synthase TruA [Proteiniphilum sp.]|jgi:tRNA pseudouridine38-40 synthase|nr:tRNA pseudouridine(38-40) synthase TruA [Proteiniphilum sp.]MDD4158005.1 tRNA pseudouridine(38-40) synthase TruA [Proteiniphilum sp.]MDD4800225.1 tRNA pseudouridine(38-40) synthase TruA [Proteiniphilum sp.]
MPRFFMTLSYNGRNYVGWQAQPNGTGVQQVLEVSLSTILRREVKITGAGRTDAGVHARRMIAHFDWDGDPFEKTELVHKLNNFLPKDIAVQEIRPVRPDAHARFSAVSRTYSYHLTTHKDPFQHEQTFRIHFNPDMEQMNGLCDVLKEYADFTSFSKLHTDVKTNICRIDQAHWERRGDHYIFTITADRFLRNMVRAITGTLLEAGRGRLDEQGFRRIIEAGDRKMAGDSVPGHALFLEDVAYPGDIWL